MTKEKQAGQIQNPQTTQSPQMHGSNKKGKKNGVLFGVLAFFTALAIIALVFGGAFYIVIHNNVNGLTDRYRANLQTIPVLKWALPTPPDPEDPKYLTTAELKKKYQELRNKRDDLTKQLNAANQEISELQKYKDEVNNTKAEYEKMKNDLKAQQTQLNADKQQYVIDKKKVDELVANGDSTGFKAYFEKMDPTTAKEIYTQIMQEQKATDEIIKLSQIYSAMDAKAAAKILEQMGTSNLDLIVSILKNMKKEQSSPILAAMSTSFASKVTVKLSLGN